MNNRTDQNHGEVVYTSIIFHIPDSWLNLLNGYGFFFSLAWHSNPAIKRQQAWTMMEKHIFLHVGFSILLKDVFTGKYNLKWFSNLVRYNRNEINKAQALQTSIPGSLSLSLWTWEANSEREDWVKGRSVRRKFWKEPEELRMFFTPKSWPFFILKTRYPSERTWRNICSPSGYASLV